MSIREYTGPSTFVVEGSPYELRAVTDLAYVKEGVNARHHENTHHQFADQYRNANWYGDLNGFEALDDLLTNGWSAGAKRLAEMTEKLAASMPRPANVRRKMRWADDGDEIDVQRVYSGHLDRSWRAMARRKKVQSRQVSIVTAYGGSCIESAEALFWRGAAALVLTDLLEEAGYRVQVRAIYGARSSAGTNISMVRVKEYDEPAHPDMMAVALCHAGFFRVCGFRSYGRAPWDVMPGCGRAGEVRRRDRRGIDTDGSGVHRSGRD
jgi:hypothetical protein